VSDDLPDKRIELGGLVSRNPTCVAPWSASADILISADRRFVGFTYFVDERHDYVNALACSAKDDSVRYVMGDSEYAKAIYGPSCGDWFEIIASNAKPSSVIKSLSIDGFWFLSEEQDRLLAFGIANLDELLSDHDLMRGELNDSPAFIPRWRNAVI
jgi:hypothetical protein